MCVEEQQMTCKKKINKKVNNIKDKQLTFKIN